MEEVIYILTNLLLSPHNGTKKTPLHASIHNECRSKKLNTVLNHRLGKSSSYDELETIDFTLTNRLLKGLREHCVQISNFVDKNVLHGGMDNADCIEDTKSGTE